MSTAQPNSKPYPIELRRGLARRIRLALKKRGEPINLTGYTGRMQVRESARSPDVIVDLSTENGGIEIDGAAGAVTLVFRHTDTAKILTPCETDLLLFAPDGEPLLVLHGPVTSTLTITRP